uniref:Probable WRKY transcription factor 70 n=1 Tax=Tanacetum cinerariifolium TaxID=118510 RepID=A0A6L2LI54_TANCI|nr:probable WRKY transcription factor 70 [Tanacetum cinerariifolium]
MEKDTNILVQTLIRGRDSAKRLQNLLCGETNDDHVSVSVDDLLTEVSESFASGLSMLSTSTSEAHQELDVFNGNSETTSSLGQSFSNLSRNNKTPLVLVKQGRGQYKRKTGDTRIEVSNASEDCFQWRKYGQKAILNSKFPRCYYRCTYMPDQGCKAKKHVQQLENESNKFRITYFGRHTCKISPHNDNTVPRHEPGAVLDFGGSKYQQSLKTNNSTTKEMGIKPSRKPKGHANATPGSDQGCSSHSVMSNDLLPDIDLFEIEDYLSALQFADDVYV